MSCPKRYTIGKAIAFYSLLLFQSWFAFSGILESNQFELFFSYLSGLLLCGFAFWRIFALAVKNITDIVMCSGVSFSQILISLILPFIIKEHKWKMYRKIGADSNLRCTLFIIKKIQWFLALYQRYLFTNSLSKLLLLFSIIDGISSGIELQIQNYYIFDILLWITLIITTILVWLSFRNEWKVAVIGSFIMAIYSPVYIVVLFVYIIQNNQIYSKLYTLRTLSILFISSGSITLIILFIVLILLILQYRQFGTGFKKIFSQSLKISDYIENYSTTYAATYESLIF